jgi:ankyrin repeat protein
MLKYTALVTILGVFAFWRAASAQEPTEIDFGRDVQPLFKAHCIDCHGPDEQKNGFRLDRRQDALRGGLGVDIGPGSSDASRLYLRLIGNDFGQRMPPDGPLSTDEIRIIRDWIDQGAKWPDEFAGDKPATVSDPQASRLMDALRSGDQPTLKKLLQEMPEAACRQGTGGSTPLMYAALYGDAASVQKLLGLGADPNVRNDTGATALMWAVDDLEKTRLLLNSGAEVNALSDDSRTPLLIATGRFGSSEIVKLLLEHGANHSVVAPSYRGPITSIRQAIDVRDDRMLQLLLEAGADPNLTAPMPLIAALNSHDFKCIDQVIDAADPNLLRGALLFVSPPLADPHAIGDTTVVDRLLELGAVVQASDAGGRTALMLAANSDTVAVETVTDMIRRGADVNAISAAGQTALDFAKQRGKTPIVNLLIKAGAEEGRVTAAPELKPQRAASARAAVERALPLLQRVDVSFLSKSGCVSCHHNSFAAMSVATAREHGIQVDESIARSQLQATGKHIEMWRERALQGSGIPGDSNSIDYILLGLAVENYPPDAATDALARYLKNEQLADGHWRLIANRPPLGSSEFEVAAVCMHAMQVYGPQVRKADYDEAVGRTARWLVTTQPVTNADRVFQLLGMTWSGAIPDQIRTAADILLTEQRSDGGWGQIASMESDAYATGQALMALHESGSVSVSDAAYQRGVEYLLSTQFEDGSWHVRSRAIPIQPYFETGFPHGRDQWISAAATNWAVMALVPAAGD